MKAGGRVRPTRCHVPYTLGGYQVLKKWLSYRESALLGRALMADEVAYVRDVIRRIAALLLLGPDLDANYAAVKADPYAWPEGGSAGGAETRHPTDH